MGETVSTRNSVPGVIIGLVISVWWIFMGLDIGFRFETSDAVCHWLTLGGYRHTLMTVLALTLIPVCALKAKFGFLATVALGLATLTLSVTQVVYMVIATPSGYASQLFGPIVWSVMQIPIVLFGTRAWQEAGRKRTPAS